MKSRTKSSFVPMSTSEKQRYKFVTEALTKARAASEDETNKLAAGFQANFKNDGKDTAVVLLAVSFLTSWYLTSVSDEIPAFIASAFADIVSECAKSTARLAAEREVAVDLAHAV